MTEMDKMKRPSSVSSPAELEVSGPEPIAQPSSTKVLQLLSIPSPQISRDGSIALQNPHVPIGSQVCIPREQGGVEEEPHD